MKTRSMVLIGPRKMAMPEFDVPPIGPEDGLLAVEMVGICGSDVGIYKGKQTDYPPPYPLSRVARGNFTPRPSQNRT